MLGGGGPQMNVQGNPGMPPNQQQQMLQHQLMQQQQQNQGQPHQPPGMGGPGMQSQMPQMGQMNQQQQLMQQQQQRPPVQGDPSRSDHVGKVRSLVLQLKESLHNLMQITASNITHNSLVDSGSKPTKDEKVSRFDKALEEFFSISNQIELHLKTIGEFVVQQRDSHKYIPFQVNQADTGGHGDPVNVPGDGPIPYSHYLNTIKGQIHFTKLIQEILLDGARRITQVDPPPQQMMPQQQPMMQQPSSVHGQLPSAQGQM